MANIAANIELVRNRITSAAERSGRDVSEITLIAVSKTRPAEEIAAALAAGATDFGENYVQELVAKHEALKAQAPIWHFIGHLQRNKVRFLTPFCALIHVVDSLRLAEEINLRAGQANRRQPMLLQVDLACETTKFGCPESELIALADSMATLPHVDWQGLMTIPPANVDPEASRPYYQRLRQVQQNLLKRGHSADNLRHLSMGMSGDYEVAIEEGATLIRIGTAIFGPRQ